MRTVRAHAKIVKPRRKRYGPRDWATKQFKRAWGTPCNEIGVQARAIPDQPSAFERFAGSLNLSPDQYGKSEQLRLWVKKHKNHYFVPEELLAAFNLEVSGNIDINALEREKFVG